MLEAFFTYTHRIKIVARKNSLLLVEDNPDDEELTLLAFEQSQIRNEVVVARDVRQSRY
jgi:hypothetical protein